jgi:hypothetical protein
MLLYSSRLRRDTTFIEDHSGEAANSFTKAMPQFPVAPSTAAVRGGAFVVVVVAAVLLVVVIFTRRSWLGVLIKGACVLLTPTKVFEGYSNSDSNSDSNTRDVSFHPNRKDKIFAPNRRSYLSRGRRQTTIVKQFFGEETNRFLKRTSAARGVALVVVVPVVPPVFVFG